MTKIEIITSAHKEIPERYFGLVLDEIYRVLSIPANNKGLDIKVDEISIRYQNPKLGTLPCSLEDAQIICINVKFSRADKVQHRSSGHVGLQVFLPKKIKARRHNIINDILYSSTNLGN